MGKKELIVTGVGIVVLAVAVSIAYQNYESAKQAKKQADVLNAIIQQRDKEALDAVMKQREKDALVAAAQQKEKDALNAAIYQQGIEITKLTEETKAKQTELSIYKEPALTEILDTIYGAGNYARIPENTGQFWKSTDAGHASAQAKFASWPQTFGYIDNSSVFHPLMITVTNSGYLNASPSASFPAIDGVFQLGELVKKDENTIYTNGSSPSYNADGYDHMWTYQITGNTNRPLNVIGDYVVCWKDVFSAGDNERQDLVVQIHGLTPVSKLAN